jgi:hypothetical protein
MPSGGGGVQVKTRACPERMDKSLWFCGWRRSDCDHAVHFEHFKLKGQFLGKLTIQLLCSLGSMWLNASALQNARF